MNISSISDIINGKLLNNPSISFVYSFKVDLSKIKTGDLFFCKDLKNIQIAIEKGAFAIVIEEDCKISDQEIAWIKVDNIQESIVKIIRYSFSNKNLKAYYCEPETFSIFRLFSNNENNIKLVNNNIEKLLKIINKIKNDDILICDDKILLEKISPNVISLNESKYLRNIKNIIKHSLFETTFSYKDNFFNRLKIPSLYIKNFLSVYYFLNQNVDISKIKSLNILKPNFIDSNFNLVEFGKSDKFFICQENKSLYEKEISYLKDNFSYGKILFIAKHKINFLNFNEQILISNISELKSKIKNQKFNALYIIGFEANFVINYFLKHKQEITLF